MERLWTYSFTTAGNTQEKMELLESQRQAPIMAGFAHGLARCPCLHTRPSSCSVVASLLPACLLVHARPCHRSQQRRVWNGVSCAQGAGPAPRTSRTACAKRMRTRRHVRTREVARARERARARADVMIDMHAHAGTQDCHSAASMRVRLEATCRS